MQIAIKFDKETGMYCAALLFHHKGNLELFTYSYELQTSISKECQDAMFPMMVKGEWEKRYPGLNISDLKEYKKYDSLSERKYYDTVKRIEW